MARDRLMVMDLVVAPNKVDPNKAGRYEAAAWCYEDCLKVRGGVGLSTFNFLLIHRWFRTFRGQRGQRQNGKNIWKTSL